MNGQEYLDGASPAFLMVLDRIGTMLEEDGLEGMSIEICSAYFSSLKYETEDKKEAGAPRSERVNEQNQVAENTRKRGYRQRWTAQQFAARQVCKLAEELGELSSCVVVGTGRRRPWWDLVLQKSGREAREAFDEFDTWKHAQICATSEAKAELADLQVVIFNLAQALGEITDQEFDVVQAAVEKSAADIGRGVR